MGDMGHAGLGGNLERRKGVMGWGEATGKGVRREGQQRAEIRKRYKE